MLKGLNDILILFGVRVHVGAKCYVPRRMGTLYLICLEFFIVASLRNINFCTFSTLFLGFAFVADAGSPTWEMS